MTPKFLKISLGLLGLSAFFLCFHLSSAAILDVTNAEKLSLPTSTPVGQKVRVSDAFVVSGAGTSEVNGMWTLRGVEDQDGKPYYNKIGDPSEYGTGISWLNGQWTINGGGTYLSNDNVAYPWLATWQDNGGGLPLPSFTYPVIQQLIAPSTDETAVFISLADDSSFNGIYTKRTSFGQTYGGKPYYTLLGSSDGDPDNDAFSTIVWRGSNWNIIDYDGQVVYHSVDDVAYPWLVTTWLDVNEELWHLGTTALIQGELDAGATVEGAGTNAVNGSYVNNGVYNGKYYYNLAGSGFFDRLFSSIEWFNNEFFVSADDGTQLYRSSENVAHPGSEETWALDQLVGTPPAPTVTRNDIASEANWEVTTDDEPEEETPSSGGGHHSSSHIVVPPAMPACQSGDLFSTATGLPCNSSQTIPTPVVVVPTCTITSTLALGWVGPQVKCLQTILNISTDGIFGPKTKAAVILFQKAHALVPDGIVGPKTRAEINKSQ